MQRSTVLIILVLFSVLNILTCSKNSTGPSEHNKNGKTDFNYFFISWPQTNDKVNIDSTMDILWIASDSVVDSPYVRITLYKDSLPVTIIDSSAPNNGAYLYRLHRIGSGTGYQIKISTFPDTTKFDFSSLFEIYSDYSGTITVTYPDANSRLMMDSSDTVRWNTTEFPGPRIRLDLYCDTSFLLTIVESMATTLRKYPWSLISTPQGTNDLYRIKGTSESDESIFGWSEYFTIASIYSGGFSIKAPSASTKWTAGRTSKILWDTIGSPGPSVVVQLYSNDTLLSTLAENVSDDGTFTWEIPYGLTTGSTYRIKIMSQPDPGLFTFSKPFTIKGIDNDDFEPDNTLLSAHQITFDSTENRTITRNDTDWVYFDADSGVLYCIILKSQNQFAARGDLFFDKKKEPDTSFSSTETGSTLLLWTCTNAGTYAIRMQSVDTGNSGTYSLKISPFDPFRLVSFDTPSFSQNISAGSTLEIKWTPDTLIFGTTVQLYLCKDTSRVLLLSPDALPNTGNFDWDIPKGFGSGTDYSIHLVNTADNRLYVQSSQFTITGIPIDSYEPDNNMLSVQLLSIDSLQKRTITWNDTDWAGFCAEKGTSYLIICESQDMLQFTYTLFSDTGETVIASDTASSGSMVFFWNCEKSDTILTRIVPEEPDDCGRYSIKIAVFDPAALISFTSPSASQHIDAGTAVTVRWDPDSLIFGPSVQLYLYKGTSELQQLSSDTMSNNGSFKWSIPQGFGSGTDYSLRLVNTTDNRLYGQGPEFSIIGMVTDSFELDNDRTLATGIDMNILQKHSITCNDTDWIKFTAAANSRYIFFIECPDSFSVSLRLFINTSETSIVTEKCPAGGKLSLPWSNPTSATCFGQITASADSTFGTYSIKVIPFDSLNSIKFNQPNDSSILVLGTRTTLSWINDPAFLDDSVSVGVYKGLKQLFVLTPQHPCNEKYEWDIPDSLQPGDDYRIKIINTAESFFFGYSREFVISDNAPDRFEFDGTIAKASDCDIDSTQSHTITFNDIDYIKFTADSGSQYIVSVKGINSFKTKGTIQALNTSTGTTKFSSDATGYSSTFWQCRKSGIYFAGIDAATSGTTGAYEFTVELYDPFSSISFQTPASGTVWNTDSTYNINWVPEIGIFSNNVELHLYRGTNKVLTIYSLVDNSGSYSWRIPPGLESGSDYYIRLERFANPSIFGYSPKFTINGMEGDDYEPDNAKENAHKYSLGTTEHHNLPYNDIDWIQFNVNNNKKYLVRITGSDGLYTAIDFYDNEYNLIESSAVIDYEMTTALLPSTTTSVIYAKVYASDPAVFTYGDYSLTISEFDSTHSVNFLSPVADTVINDGSSFPVIWEPDTGLLSSFVNIILYQGDHVVKPLDFVPNNGSAEFPLPTSSVLSGTDYRIKIANRNNDQLCGYSPLFTIQAVKAVPDVYENDNTADAASSINIDDIQQHNLILDDTDWVQFQMDAGARSVIFVEQAIEGNVRALIRYGSPTAAADTIETNATTHAFRKLTTSTNGGSCYIEILPSSANIYSTYQLRVIQYDSTEAITFTNPSDGTVITSGDDVTVSWVGDSTIFGTDLVFYLFDDDSRIFTALVQNTGSYIWNSDNVVSGTRYRIKLASLTEPELYVFSPVFSVTGLDQDIYEPDNTPATASVIELETTQQHNILLHDTDWVKIPVESGYSYLFEYITDKSLNLQIYLYDSTRAAQSSSPLFIDFCTYEDTANTAWTCKNSGSCYLKIYSNFNHTGDYTLKITRYDTSQTSKITEPTAGTVWTAGTEQTVTWIPNESFLGSHVWIQIYKGTDWVSTKSDVPNTGTCTVVPSINLQNGTDYRLRICRSNTSDVSGPYSAYFTLTGALDPDEYEPDNKQSDASMLTLSNMQRHTLTPNDTDWIVFEADSGVTYVFDDSTSSSWLQFCLIQAGSSTDFFDVKSGETSTEWLCKKSGSWYVRITIYNGLVSGNGSPGIYSLTIRQQ